MQSNGPLPQVKYKRHNDSLKSESPQGGSTIKFLHQRLSVAVLDIKGNYHLERELSRGGRGGVKSQPEFLEKM